MKVLLTLLTLLSTTGLAQEAIDWGFLPETFEAELNTAKTLQQKTEEFLDAYELITGEVHPSREPKVVIVAKRGVLMTVEECVIGKDKSFIQLSDGSKYQIKCNIHYAPKYIGLKVIISGDSLHMSGTTCKITNNGW